MDRTAGSTRWVRVAGLATLAAVVAWPALVPHPADGFPVSSYPMFASDRDRTVVLATAVGLTAEGEVHRLGPGTIGGGDEVMLAAEAARLAIAAGRTEARRFCAEVADRVDDEDLRLVQVRTETRDAVADPRARELPLAVEVHAECPVPTR
jgi:hypothetical protein